MTLDDFERFLDLLPREVGIWQSLETGNGMDWTKFQAFGYNFVFVDTKAGMYRYSFFPTDEYKGDNFSGLVLVDPKDDRWVVQHTWDDNKFGEAE